MKIIYCLPFQYESSMNYVLSIMWNVLFDRFLMLCMCVLSNHWIDHSQQIGIETENEILIIIQSSGSQIGFVRVTQTLKKKQAQQNFNYFVEQKAQ